MLMTQIEFAAKQGWRRSYVTQLKAAGRLVMEGKMVDVEASLALIARTADPSRDQVASRHAANRAAKAKTEGAVGADKGEGEKNAQTAGNELAVATDADKAAASYSESRALKEFYAAQTAKAEFERDVLGKLCETAEVERAGQEIGILLRTKLEGLADRLAPVLAPVADVSAAHALLVEHFEDVLREISGEFSKIGAARDGVRE